MSVKVAESTIPMKLVEIPLPRICRAVGPHVCAIAMLLVVLVLSKVGRAIRPFARYFAMHVVSLIFAFAQSAISMCIMPMSMELVVLEATYVPSAGGRELSIARFHASYVLSFVACPIRLLLVAMAMPLIILPLPRVLCAIQASIQTLPVRFVKFPLALIDITMDTIESSMPMRLVSEPLPFVLCPSTPDLNALGMSLAMHIQLARVCGTAWMGSFIMPGAQKRYI